MSQQPGSAAAATPFVTQPVVRLVDGASQFVRQSGVTVTVAKHSGVVGTLSGTLTAVTDAAGQAVFTNLQMSAGESGVTLDFTASGLVSVTSSAFAVTGGAPTADFATDWQGVSVPNSTSAGLRNTASTTPWSSYEGNGRMRVVSASGLGFPAGLDNVVEVDYDIDNFDWLYGGNVIPALGVGESVYFRFYMRHAGNNVDGPYASAHPVESEPGTGGVVGKFWTWKVGNWADGSFPFGWQIDDSNVGFTPGSPQDGAHSNSYAPLPKNQTRRIELKMTRTGTDLYSTEWRIYDTDDTTLQYDKNNSYVWGGGGTTMASAGVNMHLDDHTRAMRLGRNGGWTGGKVYWGAVRVSRAGWNGPWTLADK